MKSIFIILLVISSCNYKIDKGELEYSEPSDEMLNTISYKQLRSEVLVPKCLSCHGNSGGVNLETYESTYKHLADIHRSCLQTKTMPKAPVSSLDSRQVEVLTAWIEAGGPENPRNTDAPDTDETESTSGFNKIKQEIIEPKCISCHMPGEHAGHIPLNTKDDLLNSSLNLLVPGKPDASLFYTITGPGAMNMMPPIGVEPLTDIQREMIRVWIQEGAQ